VLPIPLAGDERHMYGSIDIKCKTRTRNAVSVAALQERLGYLAIILGLVGLVLASSGPHAAPGVNGRLWLAFSAAMWSTPGVPRRARAVGKDHQFKKVSGEETKRALFPSNCPQSR
jgi:hypothetical protein